MLKNLLYFAILTALVVLSWIIFGVYHNSVTSTISTDTSVIITPIPPKFDQDTLQDINSRKQIPADLSQNRASSSPRIQNIIVTPGVTQQPNITSAPAASGAAQQNSRGL